MIHNYIGSRFSRFVMMFTLLIGILFSIRSSAQFSIAAGGTNYTQDFNTLSTAGAWANNTTLTGWYARTSGGTGVSITAFSLGTGTTSGAGFYSFASTPTTDRAVGFVTTNGFTGNPGTNFMGWRLVNNTGASITSISVSYRGEQYRNNGNPTPQTITVSYLTGSNLTDLTASGFISVSALTFTSPVATATAAAVDGNVAGLVTLSTTIDLSGSPLANGAEIFIRFSDVNDSGNDHTLAIDDVTINATTAAPSTNDNLSDIIADATFTPTANINYTLHQETDLTASSLEIGRFIIRDGGSSADADAAATTLTSLAFAVSNGTNVRRLAIYDGSTEVAEIAGGTIASFTGLSLVAPDNGTKVFSLRASFNTSVTDNNRISYVINNISSDVAGSGFANPNGGAASTSTAGDDNRIEVVASAVTITTQPVGTTVNTPMANVVALAVDANNNRDFDFAGNFTATSTGALSGSPVVVSTIDGLATFTGLTFTAPGNGLTLSISAGSFAAVNSNAFNIIGPPIIAWDFTGASAPATFASTSIDANLSTASGNNNITRGPGAAGSAGGNSFRTQGFGNNGISVANTDYFQVTIVPNSGFKVSLSTIDANLNGTNTYAVSPGVTNQFAYSLDGTNFTLIGSPSITIGQPVSLPQIDVSGITALQNVSGTIYIRYYASGQTTGGGWGFFSASPGTNGLAIGGLVEALQCNDITACNYNATATSNVDCIYAQTYFIDADGDGFASGTSTTCTPGAGFTTTVLPLGDCNDANVAINPSAAEISCNGIDDNCNTTIDENDVVGCTDGTASNFNPAATCPGLCTYSGAWTPGNLVVLRGGNGVDALPAAGTSNATFLEQITPTGSTVNTLPLTIIGSTRLSQNIGSSAEGFITRTSNGDGIVVAGYDQPAGVANVSGSGVGAARVANFIDASYSVSRLFSSTDLHAAQAIRSAAKNGTNYWTAGNNQGINYAGSGVRAVISSTVTNTRVVKEYEGELYFSTGSGTQGIYKIENGLPTSGSNAATIFLATTSSPYDFEFSPNGQTIYVADDNNSAVGGVYKYTFNGTAWSLAASYTIAGYPSVSSIAVDFSTATPTIYAVSRSATETVIVSFPDNNVSGAATFTTIKTSTFANARYRSIDFVPCNGTTWYRDADGDGFGVNTDTHFDCIQPFGYVAVAGDCNDAVATIYPGALEICNGISDDCDLAIDENCITPPANDNRASAVLRIASNFPGCTNISGNLSTASNSPDALSSEPVGAGQDVWYRFVATTNGARIQASSATNDLVLEVQTSAGTLVDTENATGVGGSEILVLNGLVPGQTYFLAVRNFNTAAAGAFTLCIQSLVASDPDNGTSFSNLCGAFKCDWNGAQLFSVTFNDGVNQYTVSSPSTTIPFTAFGGLQYNTTYQVTITTTFIQNDATGGNPTTVVVVSPAYTITIGQHPLASLRSTDRCPAARPLNAFISADRFVCGVTTWQWEFVEVDPLNPASVISLEPIVVNTSNSSRILQINQIPGVQAGDRYRVRVRPVFNGVPGVFTAGFESLCIASAAGMQIEEEGTAVIREKSMNVSFDNAMVLYPNPNRGDMFTIQAGELANEQVFVRIMDMMGKEVYSHAYSVDRVLNVTIQMDRTLSAGVYMIELTDGSDRQVQRMIVE